MLPTMKIKETTNDDNTKIGEDDSGCFNHGIDDFFMINLCFYVMEGKMYDLDQ